MTAALADVDSGSESRASREALLTLGATLVLAPTLIRLSVLMDPMPLWATDLLVMWIPPSGMGPLGSILLDLCTMLGCAAVLMGSPLHAQTAAVALGIIGALGVLAHLKPDDANAVAGLPWAAAVCAGLAAAHLPSRSAARAAILAALLGMVMLLGAKAPVQVFVEHADTIDNYQLHREQFLASRGWSPDSMMARNYERRLMQPEATGWFGLANVFGSLTAAFTLLLAVMCVASISSKITDRRVHLLLWLGAGVGGVALVLSHSKGAVGAFLLAVPAAMLAMRLPRRAGLVVGLVPVCVLAGVIVRGLIGERISELSILFRWFYMQGATGVFLDHPWLGVGPAGFKDAYMLAKPALSPEEVSSPHSIFFDWLACLGAFAAGWIVLAALACRSIGQGFDSTDSVHAGEAPGFDPRSLEGGSRAGSAFDEQTARVGLLIAAGVISTSIAASAYFERHIPSSSTALARAIGLLGGLGIAWATVRVWAHGGRGVQRALAGAALVILAHAQIETTLVHAGAAPAAALLIGLACAPPTRPRCPRANPLSAAMVACLALSAGALTLPSMWSWSNALTDAAEAVRPIGEAVAAFESAPPGSSEQAEAVAAIATIAGVPIPKTGSELERAMAEAQYRAAVAALPSLESALRARPYDEATRRAVVRVHVALATASDESGRASEHATRALAIAVEGTGINPASAGSWGLLANVHLALAGKIADAGLEGAIAACERAAALDPFGSTYPLKLVDLFLQVGRLEDAREWALRALEADRNLRLDPLRQLTAEQRGRLEQLARER